MAKKTDKSINELTLLSTPKPISSSTTTKKKSADLCLDSSFGIISIKSDDLDLIPDRLSYQTTEKTRNLLSDIGLPSKYLRPTTNFTTIDTNGDTVERSASTINESDLVFSKQSIKSTSTPKCSNITTNGEGSLANSGSLDEALTRLSALLAQQDNRYSSITTTTNRKSCASKNLDEALTRLSNLLEKQDGRFSSTTTTNRASSVGRSGNLGEAMARLSNLLSTDDRRLSLDDFAKEFQKTMSLDYFKPAEEMMSQLQNDEIEWNNQNSLPILEHKDITTDFSTNSKVSMGVFFQKKSDNLGEILAKSPTKQHKPVPLINLTTTKNDDNNDSWSISKIKQILTETQTTPSKALDMLNKPKIKSKNFSEVEEKENIDNNMIEIADNNRNVRIESPNSETLRSSSSLSQLPNGKLPIETTNRELIWDCVKIGKDCSQQFTIRNKSGSKLRIQLSLSGPVFKIKETSDFEYRSIIKLYLHSYEARTISVRFTPLNIGACFDEINFQSIDLAHEQTSKQSIKLYGYGGCGFVSIANTFKDASGKFLISLGNIGDIDDNRQEFKQNFLLKNNGNLASFALCNFQLKTIYKFTKIDIKPQKLVLLPQQEQIIEIVFQLTKQDVRFIKNCQQFVIDLGVITLITGTEVNRGRIRRLCRKLMENNQQLDSLCQQLHEQFPNESIPNDVKQLKESVQYLERLLTNLNRQEITIILENNCDSTIISDLNDHTITFHSFAGIDTDNNTQFFDVDRKSWKIEPNIIILTRQKVSDIIVIASINKSIDFEIVSRFNELDVEPKSGRIAANQNVFIGLKLRRMPRSSESFNIAINIDDDTFSVTVKVLL